MDHLDRDHPPERLLFGAVNPTHAAHADELLHHVGVCNDATNERVDRLRLAQRSVLPAFPCALPDALRKVHPDSSSTACEKVPDFVLPAMRQVTFQGRLTTVCAMAEGRFHGSARGLRRTGPAERLGPRPGSARLGHSALLPSLHRGSSLSGAALALLPLGPVLLGAGLWSAVSLARPSGRCDGRARALRAAPYFLLCGYPISLALSASRFDHDPALATFSPWVLAFRCWPWPATERSPASCARCPESARSVDHKPLGEFPPVDLETRRQSHRKGDAGGGRRGALGLVSWGSWASPAHFRESGDARRPKAQRLPHWQRASSERWRFRSWALACVRSAVHRPPADATLTSRLCGWCSWPLSGLVVYARALAGANRRAAWSRNRVERCSVCSTAASSIRRMPSSSRLLGARVDGARAGTKVGLRANSPSANASSLYTASSPVQVL